MGQFYTYLHCTPDFLPFYVGKGSGKRAYFMYDRNPHHQNKIKKYGKENIKVFVFPCDSEKQAFSDEIQQIRQLRRDGYDLVNLTDGGDGATGFVHSEETRLKMSAVAKGKKKPLTSIGLIGNKNSLGVKRSNETKKKMSEANSDRFVTEKMRIQMALPRSDETKKRMSVSAIGNTNWLGRKHKPESIQAKALASKYLWANPEYRERVLAAMKLAREKKKC